MRRHVLVVIAVLLCGATVTTGLAWACALAQPMPVYQATTLVNGWPALAFDSDVEYEEFHEWELGHRAEFGATLTAVTGWHLDAAWWDAQAYAIPARSESSHRRLQALGSSTVNELNYRGLRYAFSDRMYGWPLRALAWQALYDTRNRRTSEVIGGIRIGTSDAATDLPRVVPVAPLWAGFLADTLLFGFAAWVVIAGPIYVRRVVRKRRGQCPYCGYPYGASSVCTECGREFRTPAKHGVQ